MFFEKLSPKVRLIIKIAVAAAILAAIILNYNRLKTLDVRALVDGKSLVAAAAVVMGVYALKSVLFVIPAMLIYTSVGVAFDPAAAVVINIFGIAIEVTLTYLLGRFLGADYVSALLKKSKPGEKLLERKVESNFKALLISRFLPVVPIDFFSLLLGSVNSKFPVYLAASLLGIVPRVVLFTLLGEGVYELIPMQLIITLIIIALAVAIPAFLIGYFVKRRKKQNQPDKSETKNRRTYEKG